MSRYTKYVGVVIVTVVMALFAVLGLSAAANAAPVNAGGATLNFGNTSQVGTNATIGTSHRYTNVFAGVDAILTVKKISNLTVSYIDRTSSTTGGEVNSKLSAKSGGAFVTYTVDFVESGTTTPVTLQNIAINVADIDAKQYVEFAGVQSYILGDPSSLTVTDKGAGTYRFADPTGRAVDTSNTAFWAQVNYDAISSVDITLGSAVSGFAYFDISFGAASWTGHDATPVTPAMVQYTITYDGNDAAGGTQPASTTFDRGSEHTLADNSYTNGSAIFLGWNTSPDGLGTMFPEGATLAPSGDLTLYAIWQVPEGIDLSGGDGDPVDETVVPIDVPDLVPGSEWELNLIPTDPPGEPIPLDSGKADENGEAHGSGKLPDNLPEGSYELEFSGVDESGKDMNINIEFDVTPAGLIDNKSTTERAFVSLAQTGAPSTGWPLGIGAGVMALGATLMLVSRRRKSHLS